MSNTNRCPKCMREKEYEQLCPHCGYDGAMPNPERALPVGTVLNEKYMIGAVLGEGGFGITYAAWDMLIGIRVAIKEYFPSELVTRDTTLSGGNFLLNLTLIKGEDEADRYQKGIARFVGEAQNLAKFQSRSGVVSVKEFFSANQTAYIVMEYIDGVTLNDYLQSQGGKTGVDETFQMIGPVMKTLEEIHREGVIHRDISPDNIMVTADGQMKLIDFGAARFVGVGDEKSLTLMLKHGYAPEEQYRSNGEQGPWTDVYALSAVIYRMLTGNAPEEVLTRMMAKQDDVHTELWKVQGLSDARKRTLEKGLVVKAEERIRTADELYRGIYEEKRDIRKWAICAAAVLAAVFCVFLVGRREKGKEAWIEAEGETLVSEEVGSGEKETEKENVPEEPEYVRALREYYNENCLNKKGNVWFADLTGDGEDEMIVAEKSLVTKTSIEYDTLEEYYTSYTEYVLRVYQCQNNTVMAIYEEQQFYQDAGGVDLTEQYPVFQRGIDYFLSIDEELFLLVRHWELVLNDTGTGTFGMFVHKTSYFEKISFKQADNVIPETSELTLEESQKPWRHSLLLIASSEDYLTNLPRSREKGLEDYRDVLEIKKGVTGAIDISANAGEAVLDYGVVYDDGLPCIFAVTGDYGRYLKVVPATVWALYDGHIEKQEILDDKKEFHTWYDPRLQRCDIFQFGNSQHYSVLVMQHSDVIEQHKFCFENGQVREIDETHCFVKGENGKTQISAYGFIEPFGESNASVWAHTSLGDPVLYYVDMFYYDGQYVEYGNEQADNDIIKQFENYREILHSIEEEFLKKAEIPGWEYRDYAVERMELDHIIKSVNDVYYLNYRVYGVGSDDDIKGETLNLWAHAVLEAKGSQLEFKEIVWTKKDEESGLGFPMFYGADKKMAPSKMEMAALIEEKSRKTIQHTAAYDTAVYDDYDGDGRYELFACVADEWKPNDESWRLGPAIGCSIWFSDGEQTVWVADMEDGLYGIGTLEFGESKHFYLQRSAENNTGKSYKTTCALENGTPRLVIKDEIVDLGNDTVCREQYNLYDVDDDSSRYTENYPIFYKDGEYWEYASKPISISDLQQYANGGEIINQLMEVKAYYDGDIDYFDYNDNYTSYTDFLAYPYVEVESILINSEHGDIIVNMRHWKSEEEAEYYKSLTGEALSNAISLRDPDSDGSACLLSETILSVTKDNRLYIKDTKGGHREVKGTEFKAVYPE